MKWKTLIVVIIIIQNDVFDYLRYGNITKEKLKKKVNSKHIRNMKKTILHSFLKSRDLETTFRSLHDGIA